MSAIIVLILRILLIIFLYIFLITAILIMWRQVNIAGKAGERGKITPIRLEMDDPQQSMSFTQPELLIGRDADSDFQLEDETVSGIHARIFFRNSQWMIEDLHSTNGTYINDERIATPTVLVSQDIISCGARHFSIIIEGNTLPPRL